MQRKGHTQNQPRRRHKYISPPARTPPGPLGLQPTGRPALLHRPSPLPHPPPRPCLSPGYHHTWAGRVPALAPVLVLARSAGSLYREGEKGEGEEEKSRYGRRDSFGKQVVALTYQSFPGYRHTRAGLALV